MQAYYLKQQRDAELRLRAQPDEDPMLVAKRTEAELQYVAFHASQAWDNREAQIRLSETQFLQEWQLKTHEDAMARARA